MGGGPGPAGAGGLLVFAVTGRRVGFGCICLTMEF